MNKSTLSEAFFRKKFENNTFSQLVRFQELHYSFCGLVASLAVGRAEGAQ